jgi:hypothetical protein
MPPGGASPNLVPPPMDATGVRHTVNYGISAAQITWNLRSAYNVAALNCLDPKHAQIIVNYRAFLKTQARKLATVNLAVDKEFRQRNGARFVAQRETYMTQVYNYFALPPTLPEFCDTVLAISSEAATVKSAELDDFAGRSLSIIDRIFQRFFLSYDQYRVDLSAWQAKYTSSSVPPPSAPTTLAPSLPPPGTSVPR